jgi:hypothetical protein
MGVKPLGSYEVICFFVLFLPMAKTVLISTIAMFRFVARKGIGMKPIELEFMYLYYIWEITGYDREIVGIYI